MMHSIYNPTQLALTLSAFLSWVVFFFLVSPESFEPWYFFGNKTLPYFFLHEPHVWPWYLCAWTLRLTMISLCMNFMFDHDLFLHEPHVWPWYSFCMNLRFDHDILLNEVHVWPWYLFAWRCAKLVCCKNSTSLFWCLHRFTNHRSLWFISL